MKDYLKKYCLENIWCNPAVDKQFFIRMIRMTKHNGDIGATKLGLYTIPLPDQKNFYHVYQLGGNSPKHFNFLPVELNKWFRADSYSTYTHTMIQFYTNSGLLPARFLSYLRITTNGTILVAVQLQPSIVDLNKETLGIRFYTNAWYTQQESWGCNEHLKLEGTTAIDESSFLELQTKYYNYRGFPGHAYLIHNGEYVTDAPPNVVNPGDILELVYDSSIDLVYDFKMNKAYSFLSILDSVRKYLIHPLKSFGKRINFWDDVTFILGKTDDDGIFRGRQVTNWDGKRIRMVTHNDFAIAVSVIVSLLESKKEWDGKPVSGFTLRMLFRRSGKVRPLVDVHERILELYKLDDDMIIKVMTGQIAGPDEWKVDNLENGDYTKMMRVMQEGITDELVESTLGYNAMAKITADNPKPVVIRPKNSYVKLDYLTSKNTTLYEYNLYGVLINVVDHPFGDMYYPTNKEVRLIEPINSVRRHSPEYYLDKTDVLLNKNAGYRFYIKSKTKQTPWEDVTDKQGYYRIDGEYFKWNIGLDLYNTLILSDYYHVYNEFESKPNNDVFEFDITLNNTSRSLPVPMGRVEVWLNGHALVQHVDFDVKWPHVVITNVEYLVPNEKQKIQYRVIGFCNQDLSMVNIEQFGFVRHGYISLNNRYDVRENKVVQIIVGGKVVDRSQVFSDEEGGRLTQDGNGELVPLVSSYVKDGQPYQITDVDVSLRYLVDYKTDILKPRSQDLDGRISDFMTLWKPEVKLPNPITVEAWYKVYSPFMGKILSDLNYGVIKLPDRELSEIEIEGIVGPYKYLLEYEVCNQPFPIDFVVVYTHGSTKAKTVSPRIYAFLNELNKRYLKSCINLNRCLTVTKK